MEILSLWGIGVIIGIGIGFIFAQIARYTEKKAKYILYAISASITVIAMIIANYIDIIPNTLRDKWIIILFGWMQLIYFYFATLLLGDKEGYGTGFVTQYLLMAIGVVAVSSLLLIDYESNWWINLQIFIPSIALIAGGAVLIKFGGIKLFILSIIFGIVVGFVSYYSGNVAGSISSISSFIALGIIHKTSNQHNCQSGYYWNNNVKKCVPQ